ncbi:MAG: hypothetical protein E7425_13615 [Ruminococcaceae bacterium]|jgi:hypothetical protein|nr:hypothetical protein [Oscillospiraceae bacterium]
MGKELFKFTNDKKGFRILLIMEALVALWALAATFYAISAGRSGSALYGAVTVFAIFYILGRSFRSYRNIVRQEKEDAAKETEKK